MLSLGIRYTGTVAELLFKRFHSEAELLFKTLSLCGWGTFQRISWIFKLYSSWVVPWMNETRLFSLMFVKSSPLMYSVLYIGDTGVQIQCTIYSTFAQGWAPTTCLRLSSGSYTTCLWLITGYYTTFLWLITPATLQYHVSVVDNRLLYHISVVDHTGYSPTCLWLITGYYTTCLWLITCNYTTCPRLNCSLRCTKCRQLSARSLTHPC